MLTCPLCLRPFDWAVQKRRPVQDHCHACGRTRDFLCSECNRAEGFAKSYAHRSKYAKKLRYLLDDPGWQARLLAYLDSYECIGARSYVVPRKRI
ncbi:MAG TPA: hypothetical protein DCP69_10715 [Candidatus Omnitrophica bacterium]|nr:hypothetical protein [Candidatus Omnitrophota bacterium]